MRKAQPSRVVLAHLQKRGAGKTYYWAPSSPGPVSPGFRVPPSYKSMSDPKIQQDRTLAQVERVFEEVRQRDFPGRPSRIGAVFVCPALEGFCRTGKRVYEVEVQGKTFQTDAEMFTEARINAWRGDPDEYTASWAKSYWEGGTSWQGFNEVLAHGTVTVLREVS